jgi:hypothetical protein
LIEQENECVSYARVRLNICQSILPLAKEKTIYQHSIDNELRPIDLSLKKKKTIAMTTFSSQSFAGEVIVSTWLDENKLFDMLVN